MRQLPVFLPSKLLPLQSATVGVELFNDYFAHQNPDGVLIRRFNDRTPPNESLGFQDATAEDWALLDIMVGDRKTFAHNSELGKGHESRKNKLSPENRDIGI
ncbi:hypothetical protein F5Y01DRAFT_319517 [Xylaria sp. FL0043]|nr:hypothetical protein F5Y01DRAFT_319517 [Xylaria sp. FL0043]